MREEGTCALGAARRGLSLVLPVTLGAAVFFAGVGPALGQTWATYEDWKAKTIRCDRWAPASMPFWDAGFEVERAISKKTLHLTLRREALEDYGGSFSGLRLGGDGAAGGDRAGQDVVQLRLPGGRRPGRDVGRDRLGVLQRRLLDGTR
jgi:hypothetical protein